MPVDAVEPHHGVGGGSFGGGGGSFGGGDGSFAGGDGGLTGAQFGHEGGTGTESLAKDTSGDATK